MIDLFEKADKYAVGKANAAMDKAIAQAYADGYRDGYKDREEEIPIDLRDNKTEFVDLGLPSGTLWAAHYETNNNNILYLPFIQAKRYNLPTRDQWGELVSNCLWGKFGQNVCCVGKNGARLYFPATGIISTEHINGPQSCFWLLEATEDDRNSFVRISTPDSKVIESCFMGCKLPIRQVR